MAEEDRFCGHCGHLLGRLTLWLEGRISSRSWAPLGPWRDWSSIPGDLRLVLRNEGVGGPLEVDPQAFACQPAWIELSDAAKVLIYPGESVVWAVSLKLPASVPAFASLDLGIKGADFRSKSTIVLSHQPEVALRPLAGALGLKAAGVDFHLELQVRGGAALPALLESRTDGLTLAGYDRDLATPQSPAGLRLRLEPGLAQALMARRAAEFKMELAYPDRAALVLDIPCRGAPAPQIRGRELSPRLELAVVEGFESHPLMLALGNGTPGAKWHRPWRIARLEVDVPGATGRVPDGFWPTSVESGQTLELALIIDCEHYPAVGALRFVGPDDSAWVVPVRLDRVVRGVYEGWLLLDVGTRGSCAAGKKVGLPVDFFPELEDGLVDSSVGYIRLAPSPEVCIGAPARELGRSACSRHSVVGAAKRSLLMGTASLRVIPREEPLATYDLPPRRVLGDFLRIWLQRLQLKLWSRGETGLDFTRVLLCHPARCSEEEKATLIACLREALWVTTTTARRNELELVALPESLAAAFSFLSGSSAPKSRRTVLVYDLGGTTLDLCLLEFWAEGKALKWRVLGVDGATDIGGERVIDQLTMLAIEGLSRGLPGQPPLLACADLSDDQAFEEFMRIRGITEEAVIEACQGRPEWKTLRFGAGHLHFLGENGLEALPATELDLSAHDLENWLGPTLEAGIRCAQRLVQRAGLERPDTIVRAGRASSFPLVVRALERGFLDSDKLAATDPKRCVALGAQRHPRVLAQEGLVLGDAVARCSQAEQLLVGSLGIQMHGRFLELFPAGTRFGEEVTSKSVPGVQASAGAQMLTILQNRGLDDRIRLDDGSWNPEIQKLKEALLPAADDPLTLTFELTRGGLRVTAASAGHQTKLMALEATTFAAWF